MTVKHPCNLPTAVSLHLTEVCNLRCKMCYAWGETGRYIDPEAGRKPMALDLELVKRIVRELAPAQPTYSLFGGEPLIYPHLEEVIRAIKEAGSFIDTPTNGTLLARHAAMLVQTRFDSVRVSIDGTREVNDSQRGKGSFKKAMAGIEALHREKQKAGTSAPIISIIYTVTPENHLSVEEFFLHDINLSAIDWVTIQMQNFLTEKMGEAYARLLRSKFGLTSDRYWRAMVRTPEDFGEMNTIELAHQVNMVCRRFEELGKNVLLLPPTFSPENLTAYLEARWGSMTDTYRTCAVPWNAADVTATGDLSPCHVFYDLVMGNLYEHSFEELWNSAPYRSFRAHIERHGLLSICPGCCILYLAGS
ncbi:MAG: radical SAM protein [Candidatus Hydrogenedentota bacterium]|nr:MAG: radical SAM protein [Candidatus Hydrogenedentota bacterium]